jgi:tRNA-2-methylthio-N6-dimethylallyladenosine synthase
VGFPGETEADFEQTLSLMREVRFEDAFMYRFNPKPGTRAFDMGDHLDEDVKLARLDRVIRLQREISAAIRAEQTGKLVKVLAESVSRKNRGEILGRTEYNQMVVVPGSASMVGSLFDCLITGLAGNTLRGVPEGA